MVNHPSNPSGKDGGSSSRPAVNQALRPYTSQTSKVSPFGPGGGARKLNFSKFKSSS
jgi:hypothetical protein